MAKSRLNTQDQRLIRETLKHVGPEGYWLTNYQIRIQTNRVQINYHTLLKFASGFRQHDIDVHIDLGRGLKLTQPDASGHPV